MLNMSAIVVVDTLLPPVDMNGSLCFSLNSYFLIVTQKFLVSHCLTGFQPNKHQTVKLFFFFFSAPPVTRCSTNSHLRLNNVLFHS